MKVAIIGSGPAGLASARFLVQAGIIPKIFSSDHNVGGLWKEDRKENIDSNQKCWKSLHTNLSKYTCSFSDFPWLTDAPMFPSFHDMHKYLKAYTDYYLKPEYFSFCSTVIKTSRNIDGGFLVEWMDEITNQCHTEEFNAVVVASGFHNDSIITESVPTSIPYIHSSAYRSHERYHNKRVVVVGASYSATEISAEISQYTKSVYNIQSRPIYTIPRFIPSDPLHPASPRLPLDMVFYTVNTKDIDAEVWNEDESVLLSQPAERLIRSDEDRSARKAFFDKLVYGVDYNDINKDSMSRSSGDVSSSAGNLSVATRPESNDVDLFPFSSISDTFNQQQLAKKIEIVYGRYLGSEGSKVNVLPSSSSTCNMAPTTVDGIHDVDEIIFCTGMRPRLDYLDTSILQALQYEKEDAFLPVVLYKETLHPDVPGLYFTGCHKGPYFAVIELQAKYVARLLSKSLPPPAEATVTEYLDKIRRMRTLPRSIKPQLPHSDYVRFASIIASEMNILPSPSLRRRHRVFMPALFAMSNRYMSSDATSNGTSDGERVMSEMNEMMNKYKDGFGIALHIFQSLQGKWKFERSLDSELGSSPSGTVSGHVDFTVLSPKSASELSSEEVLANTTTYSVFTSKIFPDLLYEENGVFKTNKGFSFDVSRRYIYTYNNTQDSLDIYFAKAVSHDTVINSQSTSNTSNINTGESLSRNITPQAMSTSAYERDYLFVSLSFVATEQGWLGTACHPCGKDLYNSKFLFALRGVFLDNMRIEYTVKGPHKDYLSVTTLKR